MLSINNHVYKKQQQRKVFLKVAKKTFLKKKSIRLKSVADFVRDETVGQIVPDLPAERRALLLCRDDVRVGDVNSARFGLQVREEKKIDVQIGILS